MSDLTHLFKVGQKVRCDMDGTFYNGTVKETYTDHIIVDQAEGKEKRKENYNGNVEISYIAELTA